MYPNFVLGNGSNLLASDAGFDGAVICTRFVRSVRAEGERIVADCGARLASVLAAAVRQSLCGAAFLQGIPATVGGAIFMNAGAQGRCMARRAVKQGMMRELLTGRTRLAGAGGRHGQ